MQYTVISQRRKTAVITINEAQEVIVKVPHEMSKAQIDHMVAKHHRWIEEALAKKREWAQTSDWYRTGRQLYLGTYWPVTIKRGHPFHSIATFSEEQGFILMTDGSEACARAAMEKFYRTQSKAVIEPILEKYTACLGVHYEKVTIRKQVTRWGSCSSKGNLSFNMKILCAPKAAIEYVVLHEVAHLKHFNHSHAFWEEVERWMPDYRKHMNDLKAFGQNFRI